MGCHNRPASAELEETLSPSDWSDLTAVTVAFVKGVAPAEVVRRMGRDPAAAEDLLHEEVWELQGGGAELQLAVQVDQLDGVTVTIEPNGWLLTTAQYAEAVSRCRKAGRWYRCSGTPTP